MYKKKTAPATPVEKLVTHIMLRGKKATARRIVSDAFENMKKKGSKNPEETYMLALENITPLLEVKARRIGGSNYQIPMEVSPKRRETLPLRWLINAARDRKGVDMASALAQEIWDASQGTGSAVKKKDDTHRMAEANKAFAHLARYS